MQKIEKLGIAFAVGLFAEIMLNLFPTYLPFHFFLLWFSAFIIFFEIFENLLRKTSKSKIIMSSTSSIKTPYNVEFINWNFP